MKNYSVTKNHHQNLISTDIKNLNGFSKKKPNTYYFGAI